MMWYYGYYPFMGFGWIFMAAFWAAVILFILWLVKQNQKSDALSILKERYAKGEITKKEFMEKKKDLED